MAMKDEKSDPLARAIPIARVIDSLEARRAAGFTKAGNGKHVMADGLIARSGNRRILPDAREEHDWTWWQERADELVAAATEVLRGRNASVFQGLVLDPLQGKPRKSVRSLALQFGVTP